MHGNDYQSSTAAGQQLQSSRGLIIMFSKLVTMAVNRSSLLRMVFENCNPLIYCAAITAI
ncbi:hypothetical protein C3R74_05380 [Acidithiobacillus ferridurans]|nr:hypothetical protein C3R74_05380 [Acidithiobacillus ferridurans]